MRIRKLGGLDLNQYNRGILEDRLTGDCINHSATHPIELFAVTFVFLINLVLYIVYVSETSSFKIF